MKTKKILAILVLALGLMVVEAKAPPFPPGPFSLSTAFTYQGHLYDANDVADGLYDFQFKLYDANVVGGQAGSDVNKPDVDVIDAYFTVELDFGCEVFDGNDRWLEIGIRPGEQSDPCTYATLVPRQEITPVPYALQTRGIFVTDEGKVGIGTTSPGEKLEVNGNIKAMQLQVTSNVLGASYGGEINFNENDLTIQASPDDDIIFKHGGAVETVRIKADGNVGIGTTSPGGELHIKAGTGGGSSPLTNADRLVIESGGLSYINQISGTAGFGAIYFSDDVRARGWVQYAHSPDVLSFGTAGFSRLRIDSSGNVGIGVTDPDAKLEVNGQVKITGGSPAAGKVLTSDANGLAIWQTPAGGADSDWTISDSNMYTGAGVTGNVGIGTTSPSEVLDVNGNININSVYKIGGATILSNAGSFNIFVGEDAGASNTTGWRNSAVGEQALWSNTTGNKNSAVGNYALWSNTTGWQNSAVGGYALRSNETGSWNSAMGFEALRYNTTGNGNSAVGVSALWSNTTGYENSAVGVNALADNTTGYDNSAVGYQALYLNTTGFGNSAVGNQAGYSNSTGSGNVFLGYKAGYSETGDNKLYIANGPVDSNVLIYGDFSTDRVGIGTTSPTEILDVNGTVKATAFSGDGGGLTNLPATPDGDWTIDGNDMYSIPIGNVGIGTTSPDAKLDVAGVIAANTNGADLAPGAGGTAAVFGASGSMVGGAYGDGAVSGLLYSASAGKSALYGWASGGGTGLIIDQWGSGDIVRFQDGQADVFVIKDGGNVGIGTTNPAYDLDVNGDIRAIGSVYYSGTEGNADGTAYNKPDYVFEEGYYVKSIEQVERFLKKENHLPWMTSSRQEKEENGDVIDMTRMAFETVETAENLQIQIIELNKRNEVLEKRIATLEKVILHQQSVSAKGGLL